MRLRRLAGTLAAVACLAFSGDVNAQSVPAAGGRSLETILRDLSSPAFATREAAQQALSAIPPGEMRHLQDIADAQKDPEVQSRLQKRIEEMAPAYLAIQAAAPAPVYAYHLKGRLVDGQGHPVAGALLEARTAAAGQELWSAFVLSGRSGEDGRFDIPVPFDEILRRGMSPSSASACGRTAPQSW